MWKMKMLIVTFWMCWICILKIVSLRSHLCRYGYRCAKSCFASFVTKGKSIRSIFLVSQILHTFFDKNTTNRSEPQLLFSLNPKTLMFFLSFFFFSIFIFIQKTFTELIWKYPLTSNLYILTLLLKKLCVSVIKVCLKPSFTKFYSKISGELVDILCIIYHLS